MKLRNSFIILITLCAALHAAPQWRVRAVEFSGNETYNDRALKSIMELKPKWPNYNMRYTEFIMRSDLEALRTFYRSNGFQQVEVSTERVLRDSVKGQVRIYITVNEGPRTRVKSVTLSANRFELKPHERRKLATKSGRYLIHANVRQDARTIKEHLGNAGFIEAAVEPLIFHDTLEHCAEVIFNVKEGPLVTVGDITFEGNKGIASNVVSREFTFKPGDTLNLKEVRNTERRLYTSGLFTFVQVRSDLGGGGGGRNDRFMEGGRSTNTGSYSVTDDGPVSIDNGNDVSANISGPPVTDDGTIPTGSASVSDVDDTTVTPVTTVPPTTEPASPDTADVAAAPAPVDDPLERLGYPDGTYGVHARLTPGDFFRLQAGVGYSTDERKDGAMLSGARVSLLTSYRNLFRQGHVITLDGKASQVSQRLTGIYHMPWIVHIPLYFETRAYYHRYDNPKLYQGEFDGVRFSVGRQTDLNLLYQVWTQWENVQWIRAPDDEDSGPEGVPEIPTQSIGGDIVLDTRDDVFNPADGSYSRLGLEVAGVFGGNTNYFVKVTFDTRWYFNYKMRNYWGSAFRAGWVEPYGPSEVVPVQTRFFGGGGNTVRGFDVNRLAVHANNDPLKGNFYIFANLIDFRFPVPIQPLFNWASAAVFIDAGNVWSSWHDINSPAQFIKDIRWSAGPGIRVDTQIRLVARLDLGFKLDKRPGESLMVWHFDLGQPF